MVKKFSICRDEQKKCKGNYSCHMQQQSQSTNYYSYIKNLSTANLLWALLGLLFFSLSLSLSIYIYIYLLCINIEIYINIYYHLPLLLSFLTIHYAPVDKNGFNEWQDALQLSRPATWLLFVNSKYVFNKSFAFTENDLHPVAFLQKFFCIKHKLNCMKIYQVSLDKFF